MGGRGFDQGIVRVRGVAIVWPLLAAFARKKLQLFGERLVLLSEKLKLFGERLVLLSEKLKLFGEKL